MGGGGVGGNPFLKLGKSRQRYESKNNVAFLLKVCIFLLDSLPGQRIGTGEESVESFAGVMHDINSRLETLKISVELNDLWFVWGCGAGMGDPYLGGRGGGIEEEGGRTLFRFRSTSPRSNDD